MNITFVLFIFCLFMVSAMALKEEQYQFLFTKFSQKFQKSYDITHLFSRFNTFKSNLDTIIAHNASGRSWKMGVNQFTDMTGEEFKAMFAVTAASHEEAILNLQKAQKSDKTNKTSQNLPKSSKSVPIVSESPTHPCTPSIQDGVNASPVNWVEKHRVTPVRDQGNGRCAPAYAFAALAALESRIWIQQTQEFILSPQSIIDCSFFYGNKGCNGGTAGNTYDFLKKYGAPRDEQYPWHRSDGDCISFTAAPHTMVTGHTMLTAPSDDPYIIAIQSGPLVVGIAAANDAWQHYSSGVLDDCANDTKISHYVTMVGYLHEDGKEVYLLKNSMGVNWGEQGFIRIEARKKLCGIVTSPLDTYPAVGHNQ